MTYTTSSPANRKRFSIFTSFTGAGAAHGLSDEDEDWNSAHRASRFLRSDSCDLLVDRTVKFNIPLLRFLVFFLPLRGIYSCTILLTFYVRPGLYIAPVDVMPQVP